MFYVLIILFPVAFSVPHLLQVEISIKSQSEIFISTSFEWDSDKHNTCPSERTKLLRSGEYILQSDISFCVGLFRKSCWEMYLFKYILFLISLLLFIPQLDVLLLTLEKNNCVNKITFIYCYKRSKLT